ncbi:MAG: hypothetical protein GMKNLPBB_02502 [Myxococcota bacterium]|nr:hypothetical protein [Myxococcota bacterium]
MNTILLDLPGGKFMKLISRHPLKIARKSNGGAAARILMLCLPALVLAACGESAVKPSGKGFVPGGGSSGGDSGTGGGNTGSNSCTELRTLAQVCGVSAQMEPVINAGRISSCETALNELKKACSGGNPGDACSRLATVVSACYGANSRETATIQDNINKAKANGTGDSYCQNIVTNFRCPAGSGGEDGGSSDGGASGCTADEECGPGGICLTGRCTSTGGGGDAGGGETGPGCQAFHRAMADCFGAGSPQHQAALSLRDETACSGELSTFRCTRDAGGATDTGGFDAGGGTKPCPTTLTCANRCQQGDSQCITGCIDADGPACRQCVTVFQQCVQRSGCAPDDDACMEQKCGVELNACFPAGGGTSDGGTTDTGGTDAGGGGGPACPNISRCLRGCGDNDSACVQKCIQNDGPACSSCIRSYQDCATRNGCNTGGPADEKCLEDKCGREYAACFPLDPGVCGARCNNPYTDPAKPTRCTDGVSVCAPLQGGGGVCVPQELLTGQTPPARPKGAQGAQCLKQEECNTNLLCVFF